MNTDEFLSTDEHAAVEALPERAQAYSPMDEENLQPGLTSPALKTVLGNLFRLNGVKLQWPVEYTAVVLLDPEDGGEDPDPANVLRALAKQVSPTELQLEESAFSLIESYGYFNDDSEVEISSHAVKFWWGHLRNERIQQKSVGSASSGFSFAQASPAGPFPPCPSGQAATHRLRTAKWRGTPNQPCLPSMDLSESFG